MWTSFFVYVAALVAVLFVPGYALLRCVGLDKTISLGFSPVVCIVLFCFLGCAFHEVGIASSSAVYVAVLVALCIGVACVKVGSGGFNLSAEIVFSSATKILALYVVLGVVAASYMFLLPLDGPGSAVQTYDNVHQFGLIRSFADSGLWCSFHTTLYLDPTSSAIDPIPGSGY